MKPERQELVAVPRSKGRGLARVMNRWQKEAPADASAFNARLLEVWPRTGGTWFHATWEPGRDGERIERWCIYEMWPLSEVADDLAAEFRGPDPASLTFIDKITGAVIPQTTITRTQWRLFHETGYCGRLAWIVQGSTGGHKRSYTQLERQVLRMMEQNPDPPAPGDLPYAPLDERVVAQLLKHDRLRKLASSTDALVRIGAMTREEGQKELRRHMVKWLAEQSLGWDMDRIGRAARESGDTPRSDRDWVRDYEVACESFIETGRFEAPLTRSSSIFLLPR